MPKNKCLVDTGLLSNLLGGGSLITAPGKQRCCHIENLFAPAGGGVPDLLGSHTRNALVSGYLLYVCPYSLSRFSKVSQV
jgi:hypothetical protein